jgi:uncharacterized repeat protein (TIGR03803 family)
MRKSAAPIGLVATCLFAAIVLDSARAASYRQISALDDSNGCVLTGGVTEDGHGHLWGTATWCGIDNYGTIFKLPEHGAVTPQKIYDFTGQPVSHPALGFLPEYPTAGLLLGADGLLYGTSQAGGVGYLCGTVFSVSRQGKFKVVYNFLPNVTVLDACGPQAPLIQDKHGNLIGTAPGAVFSVTPGGVEKVLHFFCHGNDGCSTPQSYAGVTEDAHGTIYGTTDQGGVSGQGTVFRIKTDGTETVLYYFTGGNDGALPFSGLVLDGHGNLYGTAAAGGAAGWGTVFRITPDGRETTLHSFTGGAGGSLPETGLVFDTAGNLYGTAICGADSDGCSTIAGLVFKLAPDGTYTIIHQFSRGYDGQYPTGMLIRAASGKIYGTTQGGGRFANGEGTIFEITP